MKLEGANTTVTADKTTPADEAARVVAVAVTDILIERVSVMRSQTGPSPGGAGIQDQKTAPLAPTRSLTDAAPTVSSTPSPYPFTQPLGPQFGGARSASPGLDQQAILDGLAQIALNGLGDASLRRGIDNTFPRGLNPVPGAHPNAGHWHKGEGRHSHGIPTSGLERNQEQPAREEGSCEQPGIRRHGPEGATEDAARAVPRRPDNNVEPRAPQRETPTPLDKIEAPPSLSVPERAAQGGEIRNDLRRDPVSAQPPERTAPPNPDTRAIIDDPRNYSARLIQQLITQELSNRVSHNQEPLTHTSQPLAPISPLLHSRDSINAHADQLRDILQTMTERSIPRSLQEGEPRVTAQAASVGTVGDFTRADPPPRGVAPSIDLQREGRASAEQPSAKRDGEPSGRFESPHPLSTSEAHSGTDIPHTALVQLENGRSLLKAITAAAEKIMSLETLRKLDVALETVVISAAAGVTLGVIGIELVSKEVVKVALSLLGMLRGEKPPEPSLSKAINELEELCERIGVERAESAAEMVADITGQITTTGSALPLEGIIVDGGSLGLTITDISGHFRFSNVPIESGYSLLIQDADYSFTPSKILGTVSTTNHHEIIAITL